MITENSTSWAAIGVLGLILATVFILFMVMWLYDFRFELRNINDEINRNEGQEREYWIARRRRLWLSLIPFIHWHNNIIPIMFTDVERHRSLCLMRVT